MLGIVLLWFVVYLSGMLFCKISGGKETSQLWKHLIGFFVLIFCQGVVFFVTQLLGWNFRRSAAVLTVLLLLICGASVFFCKKELAGLVKRIRNFSFKEMPNGRYWGLFFWLFLGIVLTVSFGTAGNRNDAVVETVQTTLVTDTMNQYHPFTKRPLELGVILSKKVITLPFWYSTLCLWTGLEAVDAVWVLGTLITVICSLLAFAELGGLLFFRDFKKTWLLLILMELLYLSGDYYIGATGYRQLFYGYSGEVIVSTVLIPCVFSTLYRFCGPILREDFPVEKEKMGIWGLLFNLGLLVGSSLFLTSLAWGIFMVTLAVILFGISIIGVRLTKKNKERGAESL